VSVFEILKQHMAVGAAYNSRDRELEHASACQEGTRENVLGEISAWSRATTYPVCWLEGPAGSGKSTIAHTIAKQCDGDHRLAFSFFFSRGKQAILLVNLLQYILQLHTQSLAK
jgi:Holliday junction resolvasome RuvABC ATP-dependent DNA helicase subunit